MNDKKKTTMTTSWGKDTARQSAILSQQDLVNKIQHRAYELYQVRVQKNRTGTAVSDWVQAEKEVKAKYSAS